MERRLAAILAADVVGYSRLMGVDEAGTHARLKALRKDLIEPTVAAHHGRIVKLTGDGALVEFASVVDAVESAVAIQKVVAERQADVPEDQRLTFRIGINIGDIINDDNDIYGDGVNVAVRLEALAEPGGVCVARNVYNQIKNKVDFGFEPLGEQRVKNIAEPIIVYQVLPDPRPVAKAIGLKRAGTWRWREAASAGAFVLLLLATTTALWLRPWAPSAEVAVLQGSALPLPDKPSIAVLPFDNLGDDPKQEYFADGMTEDLITDLSKVSGLFVIARNSTFAYKDQSPDVRAVARELGVRYVLEGSVRRAGDQVRINAQLIDATTGGHLWADRYDGRLDDVFAVQDGITRQIVAAMEVNLTTEDMADVSAKETDSLEAYNSFLLGRAYYLGGTREDFATAIPYLERAIALDANYGQPYATLAWIYWKALNWELELNLSRHEIQNNSRRYLQAALKNGAPSAHRLRSEMLLWLGLYDKAHAEAEQALALDASDVDNYIALARALIIAGKPAGAVDLVETAMRRNPKYGPDYTFTLGLAYFGMERYQRAAGAFEETIEQRPEHYDALAFLAATYGHLGREQAAEAVFEHIVPLNFAPFRAVYQPTWQFKDAQDQLRLAKGLDKAGIPFYTEERLQDFIQDWAGRRF